MKKYSIYALMSAIALAGSVGFSGCSSSDDVINNPDYNPETNSVKTEFAISLPNYVGASTRQTAAITQAQTPTATFRGMQNMVLIPFNGSATAPLNGKVFELADIDGFDLDDQKAQVYKQLDVPIPTSRFVFYGQAKVTGNDFNNGKLKAPTYKTVAGTGQYNFTLVKIAKDYTSAGDTKGNAICAYLKSIRETEGITSGHLQSLLTGPTGFKPIAASSASVQAAVQQLWDIVKTYNSEDATGVANIKSSIKGTNLATINDADVVTLTGDDLLGYPANLNLPDGAVAIDWQDPANPVINGETLLNVAGLTEYVYPAALYYRADSEIGVSEEPNASESYGDDTWAQILASDLYDWDNSSVGKSTRSIALKDQIQYAVGRLDLTVKAADGTLYDGDGVAVNVAEAGFPVSAVLIGGQKDVGFDFTPNGAYTYTIYDKTMNDVVAAKAESAQGTNHTLVLETAETATTVNVAVEMTNNTGHAFKGKDGTVPANGKFYLVGELNLADATHPDAGDRTKIFEQDYVTKVNFTITKGTLGTSNNTGLGAAYNVLPDLTVSQLEVAFSVDLTWESGVRFDVDL